MAGMLPGVEAARRRRIHRSGGCNDLPNMAAHKLTRRASLSLYSSNHDVPHSSCSILQKQTRSTVKQAHMDDNLGGVAREAKQRLDEKLRTLHEKTQTARSAESGKGKWSSVEGHSAIIRKLHFEVYGSKKGGWRRFNWGKVIKKGSDQDECAVCLESFKVGEILMHLSCSHSFHSRCLEPWLEKKPHCPCCRTTISSST